MRLARCSRWLLASLVLLTGLVMTGPAQGHGAVPMCVGDITVEEVRGHQGQQCTFNFQGLPIVAEGEFFTDHPNLRSNIHVNVVAVTSNGSRHTLPIECVDYGRSNDPKAQCRVDWNPAGSGAVAAGVPYLHDVVELICEAHSHAAESTYLKRYFGPEAGGWFRCSSGPVGTAYPGDPGDPGAPGGVTAPAGAPAFAAVPFNVFATNPAVVSRSAAQTAPPTYVNLDQALHDVVALEAKHPDGTAPWCNEYDPGRCPLFWSPLIGPAQSTAVLGFDDVAPGSYLFYCSIHPEMIGTVEVVA